MDSQGSACHFWFKPLLNTGTNFHPIMLIFLVGRLELGSTDTVLLVGGCVCLSVSVCIFFIIKIVTFPGCGFSSARLTFLCL